MSRAIGCADGLGRWLDSLADAVFVLTALTCEARAWAIPAYIPALGALVCYVCDRFCSSQRFFQSCEKPAQALGCYQFALVLLLAFAPPPRWPGIVACEASPLIAIFHLAAIIERVLGYGLRERLQSGLVVIEDRPISRPARRCGDRS